MQVTIHGVLVEGNEDVDLVPHVTHWRVARANGQEGVSATDDRLISVVGVEVETSARENAGENVAGGSDSLAVFAPDSNRKIYFRRYWHLIINNSICCGVGAEASARATKSCGPMMRRRRISC